jgi:PAS domain S-box-containing protein
MKHCSVLYIEDDPQQRRMLSTLLRREGYRVTPAASGRTGLRQFRRRRFDVVLCDLNMPEMDGLQVLDRTKQIKPHLPFIMLSSRGTIKQAVRAIRKGAFDFILEPPQPEEITTTIEKALQNTRLEAKLRKSEADLKLMVDNVPDVLYSLDPTGKFLSLSPALEMNLGFKTAELIGTSVFDIIHPEDRERIRRGFRERIKAGQPGQRRVEFRMLTKSGESRHYEISGRDVLENGRIVRADGIARDITERKRFEKELERSRDELQAIMDCYPDGMLMVDLEGRVRNANRGISRFFGIQFEKWIGRPYDEFLEAIKSCFEDFDRFIAVGELIKSKHEVILEHEFDPAWLQSCGVKQIQPVERTIMPIPMAVVGKNQEVLGRLWIYNDITVVKRSFDQLRTIVNAAPLPVLVSRIRDGKVIFVNDHLANLLGYTNDEVQGKTTPQFLSHPEEREDLVKAMEREGHFHDREIQIKRKDGTPVWVLLSGEMTRLQDEDVAVTGIYDINQRKLAEEALEQERNFIAAVLDTVSTLVVVLDRQGRFVRFNRACEQVTGYSQAEVLGKNLWDIFILPEEKGLVKDRFAELEAGRFPNRGENYWVTKDGGRRLIDWINTALLNEQGEVEHIIGTGIDVTEHRQMEEALQQSERKYRELVESANSVIMRWDRGGTITFFNEYAQKFFGFREDEILGRHVMGSIVPEMDSSGTNLRDMIEDIERHPERYVSNENENIKRNGERVWISWTNRPIYDEDGTLKEILSIGKDESERKAVERALQETQAQLIQSDKMASLGQLVAGVAHEINTPIGAVNSMHDTLFRMLKRIKEICEAELAQDHRRFSRLQAAFKIVDDSQHVIESGTKRVIDIITRLRSFARLDEAALKTVDIHQGLEDTLVLIHNEIKHHIDVVKRYGRVPPVSCYPGQLNQVFLNLLINAKQAILARKDRGTITITTHAQDKNILIAITDDGTGISRQHLSKIFDPGFTTKGVGVGTGLGLSICYQIIQNHRGKIKVESTPGEGTTFTIIIPQN